MANKNSSSNEFYLPSRAELINSKEKLYNQLEDTI
jgi:hypothetical protein